MYTIQPKKMLIINILDILQNYSDSNHRLSQKEIVEILEKEYLIKVDRKAVKRNLMNLLSFGYDIEFTEAIRTNKSGQKETIYTDWYIERTFSNAELRLLIDSVLFSKHIPGSQRKALIDKIKTLSNKYFNPRIAHVSALSDNIPQNKQLFYTIDVLDEAIACGKQVSFYYNEYGTDMKLSPRKDSQGKPRRYIINPYQLAATNGHYYLICNNDKYDDVSNYRLDRIADIKLLDTPAKPMKKVKGLENGFDLPKHMAEHIHMFTGESGWVLFRLKKYLVNEVIDWFGGGVSFFDETDEEVTAKVYVNLMSMRKWAMQYAVHTRIISPPSLLEDVKRDIQIAAENYN